MDGGGAGVSLVLDRVSRSVAGVTHVDGVSLALERGTLNVLLGPTLSGKTSLMRLLAGLDVPTSGRVRFDERDVTGVPVRQRSVAMVYQQFINYPSLTVYENIASPLRVARMAGDEIDRRVREVAALLQLEPYLDRLPLQLSGGQQQRTAIARALVKGADLVLLDEPLANLDYKLREELREELPRIFEASGAIFVYATTEPSEALLLGGNTATHVGGPGHAVRRHRGGLSADLAIAARAAGVLRSAAQHARHRQAGRQPSSSPTGVTVATPDALLGLPDGPLRDRLPRPSPAGSASRRPTAIALTGKVAGHRDHRLGKLRPSRTSAVARWVALVRGVHEIDPGATADVLRRSRRALRLRRGRPRRRRAGSGRGGLRRTRHGPHRPRRPRALLRGDRHEPTPITR